MSSEKYTPDESDFVSAMVSRESNRLSRHTRGIASSGQIESWTAEARRGIEKLKADAWDEGFNVSENNVMDTPNPYRENGDNND